ncbi:MAG: hypothetical protein H0V89_09965 [Deltaproteobacteria bacterium]|nr:hypothetical protein [Deltaproteobacteria bacterium]
MTDPIARLVATWVAHLDLARCRAVLRALAHNDYDSAERQLAGVVGSPVRLSDERVRDQLGDALEQRLESLSDPGAHGGEADSTVLFPLDPVGTIDCREDDPTDEVSRARVAGVLER